MFVFIRMQLQLNSAPTYFHFPSGKSKKEDRYDVGRWVVQGSRRLHMTLAGGWSKGVEGYI